MGRAASAARRRRLWGARRAVHSAAVITVEIYLKLQSVPYKVSLGDPRKAPKGKLPMIEVEGGRRIADSSAIFGYLEEKAERPLDGGSTAPHARGLTSRTRSSPTS